MPEMPTLLTSGVAGLLMAGGSSLANAVADALRKKAVAGNGAIATAFWFRVVGVLALMLMWTVYTVMSRGGSGPIAPQIVTVLGPDAHVVASGRRIAAYLAADVALIAVATALYFRAVQQSSLSVTVPMLSFTPVFLLPAGFLMLREVPTFVQIFGVMLVAGGSVLIHRGELDEQTSKGRFSSLRRLWTALMHDRGSRMMMLVALIYSITNPLDKKLAVYYGPYLYTAIYSAATAMILLGWQLLRDARQLRLTREAWPWAGAAGVTDAISLLLLFLAFHWMPVASTITVKRAGAVVTVLLGWKFFRETHLASRLAATCIMILGVCLLSLSVTLWTVLWIGVLSAVLVISQSWLHPRRS